MRVASPSRAAFFSLTVAFAASSLPACQGKKAPKTEENHADLAAAKAQAAQSLEALKTQIGALRKALSEVHRRLDALPEDMPDLGEFRSKLFSVEEVFGVEDGRVKWLAGRLDAAATAGNQRQLQEVSDAIRDSIQGNKGEIVVQLTHQLMDFERRVFTHRLPTGREVKSAKGGIEQRLIELVGDAEKKVDRTAWFAFDRVSFHSGETKVDLDQSELQLDNVAEILKAFPAVKLEIGDFTDNAGPAAAGKKLSLARAESVKKALVTLGVAAPRLRAEGYGPRNPVCPANDTLECKLKNRRIAARVTAK